MTKPKDAQPASPAIASKFPRKLLSDTVEEREAYFHNVLVEHDLFDAVVKEVLNRLTPYSNRRIFLLIGPTGVGKSAVCRTLLEKLNKNNGTLPGGIPQISAIAFSPEPPEKGDFRFESLYESGLSTMDVPLPEASRAQENVEVAPDLIVQRLILNATIRKDIPGLRNRFVNALQRHKVRLWIVEEALTIFMTGKSKSRVAKVEALDYQATRLKLLIEEGKCTLLLVGASDLDEISYITDQISRRARVIPFKAYEPEAIGGYIKGVLGLLSHLPIEKHYITPDDFPVIFERTGRVIGRTHDLLESALHLHLTQGDVFDIKLLEKCFWSSDQEEKMGKPSSRASSGSPTGGATGSSGGEEPQAGGSKKRRAKRRRRVEATPSHNSNAAANWNSGGKQA